MVTLHDIERARSRIRDGVIVSPCTFSETFSQLTKSKVYFKLENLQITGSFKERGAINKLLSLSDDERKPGVIAASAGNHAQAVAYHATRLGIRSTIVMPLATPLIKVTRTREYGAEVVLHGIGFDEAVEEANQRRQASGATLIPGFDDDLIIAGQGTVALELLEQNPFLEAVIVPIGGGGLAAGIALALKETNPKIRVIGVEAARVPSMIQAIEAKHPVALPPQSTLAEGIAVRRVGALTMPLCQKYVDEIVTVEEEEIAKAILLLLEREKMVAEGAGAAALAALMSGRAKVEGRRVAVLVSGGNIDVNMLARIIERGLVQDGRLVRLRVRVPDHPGALHRITGSVAAMRANILEVFHNRAFSRVELGETAIDLQLETRGREHVAELLLRLEADGLRAETLSPG